MNKTIHVAAFFTDSAPIYTAGVTRARTSAGMRRACELASRRAWIKHPAARMVRTYVCADNQERPADFLIYT
jgi:hypothetical protein